MQSPNDDDGRDAELPPSAQWSEWEAYLTLQIRALRAHRGLGESVAEIEADVRQAQRWLLTKLPAPGDLHAWLEQLALRAVERRVARHLRRHDEGTVWDWCRAALAAQVLLVRNYYHLVNAREGLREAAQRDEDTARAVALAKETLAEWDERLPFLEWLKWRWHRAEQPRGTPTLEEWFTHLARRAVEVRVTHLLQHATTTPIWRLFRVRAAKLVCDFHHCDCGDPHDEGWYMDEPTVWECLLTPIPMRLREEVQEATQVILMRFHRSLATFRGICVLNTWLKITADSVNISRWNATHQDRRPIEIPFSQLPRPTDDLPDHEYEAELPSREPCPHELAEREELAARLDRLNEVLIRRYPHLEAAYRLLRQRVPAREIAEVLDISPRLVHRIAALWRTRLATLYQEYETGAGQRAVGGMPDG